MNAYLLSSSDYFRLRILLLFLTSVVRNVLFFYSGRVNCCVSTSDCTCCCVSYPRLRAVLCFLLPVARADVSYFRLRAMMCFQASTREEATRNFITMAKRRYSVGSNEPVIPNPASEKQRHTLGNKETLSEGTRCFPLLVSRLCNRVRLELCSTQF